MASADSYIGCLISLTSKSEIRYEGVLYTVDAEQANIALQNVRSFGTEGRKKDGPQIPASDKVYDYIVFRGADIKDLQVKSTPAVASQPSAAPSAGASADAPPASASTAVPPAAPPPSAASSAASPPVSATTSSLGDGKPATEEAPPPSSAPSPPAAGPPLPQMHPSAFRPPPHMYPPVPGMHTQHPAAAAAMWAAGPPAVHPGAMPPNLPPNMPPNMSPNMPPNAMPYYWHPAYYQRPPPMVPTDYSHVPQASIGSFQPPQQAAAVQTQSGVSEGSKASAPELAEQRAETTSGSVAEQEATGEAPAKESVPVVNDISAAATAAPPAPAAVSELKPIAPAGPISVIDASVPSNAQEVVTTAATAATIVTAAVTVTDLSSTAAGVDASSAPLSNAISSTKPANSQDAAPKIKHSSIPSPTTASASSQPVLPLPIVGVPNSAAHVSQPPQNRRGGRGRGARGGRGGGGRSENFTEEFDFSAMNERFKKDEVWGQLGGGGETEEGGDESKGLGEDAETKKSTNYVKDDFFDSLSCDALKNAEGQMERMRMSDMRRMDTETFGEVQYSSYQHHYHHRGGRGGRGGQGQQAGGGHRGGFSGGYSGGGRYRGGGVGGGGGGGGGWHGGRGYGGEAHYGGINPGRGYGGGYRSNGGYRGGASGGRGIRGDHIASRGRGVLP